MPGVRISSSSPSRSLATVAGPVALVAAVLAVAACGGEDVTPSGLEGTPRADPAAPIVVPAGKPIIIGLSMPLTGPDEAVGKEDRDAVMVAVARWRVANGQIQGHDIGLRAEDDGCTESYVTVQAAERLLRMEGLVGVIGPDCSAGAMAAIPIYARGGIVAISGSGTRTDLTSDQPQGRFFFRTAYRNDLEGLLIGLFVTLQLQAEHGWLIDDGEAYGQDLADAAQRVVEQHGVRAVRESLPRGTVDFSALAAEIARDGPDFVAFLGFNPEAALFYRQLRDAGYTGVFGSTDAAASVPDFVEPVGPEAEGVLFAGCSLNLPEDFIDDFRSVHGDEPDASAFVTQYADAATVLLDAVAAVAQEQGDGSLEIDPAELRDAVRAAVIQGGLSGSFAFDEAGDRVPPGVTDLAGFIEAAVREGNIEAFVDLGLVPCQVQDGRLVNLLGPGGVTVR